MSDQVERFNKPIYDRNAPMQPNSDGEWVRYSGYEKEKTRADELAATDEGQLENRILELEEELRLLKGLWPELAEAGERLKGAEAERDQARKQVETEAEAVSGDLLELLDNPEIRVTPPPGTGSQIKIGKGPWEPISFELATLLQNASAAWKKEQAVARKQVLEEVRERWEQALNFCLGSMGEYSEGSPEFSAYKNCHTFIARIAAALHPDQSKAAEADPLEGLPAELAAALREPGVFVPQDASLFKLIAEWADAPSNTVSADPDQSKGEQDA